MPNEIEASTGLENSAEPPRPNRRKLLGEMSVRPEMRHSIAAISYTAPFMGDEAEWTDLNAAYQDQQKQAALGDLTPASRMLMAQAITLDAIFTRMVERASVNMGEYPEATKQYMQLALKAQANSRATLEALARIHQPREQIVKHVNVNEGGQAVFANQIHQSGGKAPANGRPGSEHGNAGQPHEPLPALLGQEQGGQPVPMPGDARQEAVPATRRKVAGRADRGS